MSGDPRLDTDVLFVVSLSEMDKEHTLLLSDFCSSLNIDTLTPYAYVTVAISIPFAIWWTPAEIDFSYHNLTC